MNSWSITPVGGTWFTMAVATVLVLVMFFGPESQRLTRRRRMVLFVLRAATLILLLMAMLRPTLVATETRQIPGSLVMLLDSSRSMQIADSLGNASRWDAMKSILTGAKDQLAELAETWDLSLYQFDESIDNLKLVEGATTFAEQADGPQTAIGSALEDVLDREAQQRIVAVLLLSDGAQRAFAPRDVPPQTAVRRLAIDNIPLYTFTFGKPALGLRSDLRVESVLVNDVVFAEAPVNVNATIGAEGYANQTYKVQLLWENPEGEMETVDTRQVKVDSKRRRINVPLTHTPMHPGEYKVSVQIESPEGELISSNNLQSTFVTVMKGGVNILYLAGASRIGGSSAGIEPRFLRSALSAYADFNVQYELLNYRQARLDLRPTLEEGSFDVFLLADLDVIALDPPTWKKIAEQVDRGAGLAMLGGFHSFGPGGYRGTSIAPLLPINIGRAERQNFGEPPRQDMHIPGPLKMTPVPIGNGLHPVVRVQDQLGTNIDWSELPLLDGANRFEPSQLKPNAQILATTADAKSWPLLVAGAWGNGRTLAFALDSTWHWHLEGFEEVHRRFWRQFILWLARKDEGNEQLVWVRLDGRRYQRGSRVEFALGAHNELREPLASAKFDVQVKLPDGSQVPVRASRRGAEWVSNFTETSLPGDYEVTVSATDNGQLLGTTRARFTVPDRDMELDQPAAEPTLMASLAGITAEAGGAGLAPEELPDLLDQLKSRTEEFEEQIERRRSLWDTWPMLLMVVSLLSTEWWLRKHWGLV